MMETRSPGRSMAGPEVMRMLSAHFGGDDAGQRGLAQAGRAVEQDVVERLVAGGGGLHVDTQAVLDFLLAEVFVQGVRAQGKLGFLVLRAKPGVHQAIVLTHLIIPFSARRISSSARSD